jgi:4-amino-4-deoxy-L-arabinose transferase-like glycosyltransferase
MGIHQLGISMLALTGVGFVMRLLAGFRSAVIARDGIVYLEVAERFVAGDWKGGFDHHYPPLYPLWLALGGVIKGDLEEGTAVVVSALGATALVPAIGVLTTRAYGRRAGLFAAFAAACLPLLVELGGQVLAESLYLPLIAWALVFFQSVLEERRCLPLAAGAAALCSVAAYLTRPEGLAILVVGFLAVLVLERSATWRRRLVHGFWVVFPALLGIVPFLLYLKGQETLWGTGSGSLKLTSKQDMGALLSGLSASAWLTHAADLLRRWLKTLGPGVLLLGVALFRRGPRVDPKGGAGKRLALLCLGSGLLLLTVFAAVRSDRRYAAALAVLTLPQLGLGAAIATRWLERRWALSRAVFVIALLAVWIPLGLRSAHGHKGPYREVGAYLAQEKTQRVLARDSRAAYYAGGVETLSPVGFVPREGRTGADLLRVVREQGFDAVVIVVNGPQGERVSRELSALVGRSPRSFRSPGDVSLDVFTFPTDAH